MQHWVKALYNSPGREAASEWKDLDWVGDGPPGQRPHYRVGDELLLYNVPTKSFPARARVVSEAVSDPDRVNLEGGPDEGRRWPFVTQVKVLGAVDLNRAPTPPMLEITITQGGHRRLDAEVYQRSVAHIPAGFRHLPLK